MRAPSRPSAHLPSRPPAPPQFASCARSLGGALLVNPWDTQQLSRAIQRALLLPAEERRQRHAHMNAYASKHSSSGWAR